MIEGVKIKFVETPPYYNFQDQVRYINMWINDMQRNNVIILSNKPHREQNVDGTVSVGFLIEYREELSEAPLMEAYDVQ
jgi:hypothetical protein